MSEHEADYDLPGLPDVSRLLRVPGPAGEDVPGVSLEDSGEPDDDALKQPPPGPAEQGRADRTLTLYRDDSTVQVRFDRVKTFFWTAGNSVLTIARYNGPDGTAHHYVHWPRERWCWFRDEPGEGA